MRKVLFLFVLFALAIASAKSYGLNLYQTAKVGGVELKPGEYRIEVTNQKAVIRNGSIHAEASVTVDTSPTKHANTTVRLVGDQGTPRIEEIRIGGTNTILKFAN